MSPSACHANVGLWIECPDCEGCGGWYGCECCGAVLSRDEPPDDRLCSECARAEACAESGGHEWRTIAREWGDNYWTATCARGCGGTRKVVNVEYMDLGDRWAYVGDVDGHRVEEPPR